MNRIKTYSGWLLLWCCSAVLADRPLPQTQNRPNVLVILVDDLRTTLGCYGAEWMHTPSIDRIAEQGVLFEHAYAQYAVCGPSRASFLTGCYPETTRRFNNKGNFRDTCPDAVTLPGHFKAHGYSTQGIGKIFHDTHWDPASWTLPRIFEEGYGYAAEEIKGQVAGIDGLHEKNRSLPITECIDVPDNAYRDGMATDEAVKALRSAAGKPGQPFCLMVGYHKPHTPLCAPKKYWDVYDRESLALAPYQQMPEDSSEGVSYQGQYFRHFTGVPDEGEIPVDVQRRLLHAYYACVSYIDAQVGILIDELEKLGLSENTVIVLTSDHGYQLGEHGLWCKHSNFEDATLTPLIVLDPRMGAKWKGQRVVDMVELIDVAPTLWEGCGLPAVPGIDGASLAAYLEGGDDNRSLPVARSRYHGKAGRGVSIRVPGFRYTRWCNKNGEPVFEELYDYERDPEERQNHAVNPEYAAKLRMLRDVWDAQSIRP